jgi:hypothetical protein
MFTRVRQLLEAGADPEPIRVALPAMDRASFDALADEAAALVHLITDELVRRQQVEQRRRARAAEC